MNTKRVALGFVAVVAAVTLGACSDPDKNKLVFKPETGSTRIVDTSNAINLTMNMMGMELSMPFSSDSSLEIKADSVDPDGAVSATATIGFMKVDGPSMKQMMPSMPNMPQMPNVPGMPSMEDPTGLKAVSQALAGAKGQTFNVKIGKFGKVIEVTGADAIADKVSADLKSPQGMPPTQSKEIVRGMIGDEGMAKALQQVFFEAPETAIKPNDTWTSADVYDQMMIPITANTTYTATSREGAILTLDGTSTYTVDTSNLDLDLGPMMDGADLKVDVSEGAGTVSMKFDETSGWMLDALHAGSIKGKMAMGPMSTPIEVTFKTTVKSYPK